MGLRPQYRYESLIVAVMVLRILHVYTLFKIKLVIRYLNLDASLLVRNENAGELSAVFRVQSLGALAYLRLSDSILISLSAGSNGIALCSARAQRPRTLAGDTGAQDCPDT